ncbi:MAG: NAD(+) synthase [Clostridia bacterium]|nr:NAD(+) synthase [Clostridia bacterium]
MQYGYIKVCAATPEIRVADVDFNTNKIIEIIKESAANGSQLTVFPELCVCGYTCGDLFNQSTLINACDNAIKQICKVTEGISTLVFVGAPVANAGRLYNCAVAICNGKILGVVPKSYLPNYGEFYEKRHFSTVGDMNGNIIVAGQTVAFTTDIIFASQNNPEFTVSAEICEDLWAPQSPSVNHAKAGANIIVNLSCSDETVGKAEYRRNLVKMQSAKLVCGYVYTNAGDGESTTDLVFAGHNLICENGKVLGENKPFKNGLVYGEIDVEFLANERRRCASGYFGEERGGHTVVGFISDDKDSRVGRVYPRTPFVPEESVILGERAELILNIQSKGLEKRISHSGVKTAVIGVSGGLDSALALLVTCRAFKSLGKDLKAIIGVTMPGFGTTNKTKSNSVKLMEALGVTVKEIPVGNTVNSHFNDIGHDPDDRNVTYENAQARMRTMVLMDIANDNDGLVIGTGDLSELALGWATYNGDHMSMYGVNCSVPKTLVKYLVAYEAEKLGGDAKEILNSILNTEISPELLPPDKNGNIAQKTEDLVGPYELHDFFLYYFVRCSFTPDKILYLACKTFEGVYDGETIKKWLKVFIKRFFAQQFKRSCVPDGVKVGSVALSPRGDWRMPSDAVCALWLKSIE